MDKCLAFCQALSQSDQKFTLNICIGNTKLFFSNKELESSWKRKKKSPSQMRREENRKRMRQNKATEEVAGDASAEATVNEIECNPVAEQAEIPAVIVCEDCGYKATTEKGLKQYKRMKHGKVPQSASPLSTPEVPRRQIMPEDLEGSPLPKITREETCHNCGEIFTSEHQCDDDLAVESEVGDEGKQEDPKEDIICNCTNSLCCACHHKKSCRCANYHPERSTRHCTCTFFKARPGGLKTPTCGSLKYPE